MIVDVVGRKVESQVQFWSLLGPFLILLSIAILLFKVSAHWYFPVSALLGIPLCVKWKMKGMAAALSCLLLLTVYGYQNLELDDRYWHVGLSLTMAFSFIVLALSLEEAQGLVNKLELESQSRLNNFVLLDEKWKSAEQEWISEREKSKSESTTLTQEIAKIHEEKQTFYKLAQLAKDELVQVRIHHNQLLQDLSYKKQQIAQLHERLEETEITIQGFVNSDGEKQLQALTNTLTNLEREKETLKAKIALTQSEGLAYRQEKDQVWQELQLSQEREKSCLLQQESFQQEREGFEQERKALEQEIKVLQDDCQKEQEDLLRAKQDLEAKNEVIIQVQNHVKKLNDELSHQHALFQNTSHQLQKLEQLKLELEQALRQTQEQLQLAKENLHSKQQQHDKLPYAPGNTRQIETMYIQLKEQFQEKCSVLDSTRRELFHANEELLKYQKEKEEEKVFGQSANDAKFQHHILQLGRKYDQMQELYQQEVDGLTSLIEQLLHQLAYKKNIR